MARAGLLSVLLVSLLGVSEIRASCPSCEDCFDYEGICIKVFDKKMKFSKAEGKCDDLAGNWRLPTGDELHGTPLKFFWVLGPDGQRCYGASNAKETKVTEIDCDGKAGVACVQVETGVPSREEIQETLASRTDEIPRTEHSNIPHIGNEITMNIEAFRDTLGVSTSSRRKKRRAVMKGLSNLRGRVGKTTGRNIKSRLPSSNGRIPRIGGLQMNPLSKETQRKPLHKNIPPHGREMCMGEWKRVGRSCVRLFRELLSWNEAQAACETFIYWQSRATLINLGNNEMKNGLMKWLSKGGQDGVSFWTSGNDVIDEEVPLWTDTDAITESDDVIGDSDENDCVANINDQLQFVSCVTTYWYVCEMREPNISEDDLIR